MLRTQIDVVSLMKSVSLKVADSFDSASIIAEFETPKELLDYSEKIIRHFQTNSLTPSVKSFKMPMSPN